MQSLSNASCRRAQARAIFSPPHIGMPIRDAGWRRLIQQEVTWRNGGTYSRYNVRVIMALCERWSWVWGNTPSQPCQYGLIRAQGQVHQGLDAKGVGTP